MEEKKTAGGGCVVDCGARSAAFALEQMRKSGERRSELQRATFDLCSVYLLNLHVYLALDEDERDDHPVKGALERIEKIFGRMADGESPGATPAAVQSRRTMTRDMLKSGHRGKRRACDASNPRQKNREKARKLFERGKHTFDGNIDVRGSRSAKY